MSSTAQVHLRCQRQKKPKKALARALLSLEQQLAELQHLEQLQLHQIEEGQEHNLILAELIYVQERCSIIYARHKQWLAAGGPDADSLTQQQLDIAMHEQRMQQQRQQQRQQYAATPHWVLHALQTACWEDVVLAMSRDCDDWVANTRSYYSKLLALSEAAKRPAALQPLLMQEAICTQRPNIPGGYSLTSSSMEDNPAWDAAVAEMQAQSRVAYIALLHGCPAIFDAASRNCVTGERAAPSSMHWISAAQRMHFTRSQRLHFKLALQNFTRVCKAAAARGLQILQEAPSYSLILACELIQAERQSNSTADDENDGGGGSGGDGVGVGDASGSDQAAATTAASAAAAATAAGSTPASTHPTSSSAAASSSRRRKQQLHKKGVVPGRSSSMMPVSLSDAAAAAAAGAASPAAPTGISTGSDGASADDSAAAAAAAAMAAAAEAGIVLPPCDADAADADTDLAADPGEQLQRQVAMYMRQVVFLNLFMADTLTVEQGLILNIASYPFTPMLSTICEAAVALDGTHARDTEEGSAEVQPQGVQVLMELRRQFMQQAQWQWWEN